MWLAEADARTRTRDAFITSNGAGIIGPGRQALYRLLAVRDPRYSTAAWQKLRKAVLARDGGICQIRRPRCRGYANSVHHLVPSSQAPELFWAEENLVAACGRCNYGDGARIAAENTRRAIETLRNLVEEQQQQITEMAERLARYERPKRPAIY